MPGGKIVYVPLHPPKDGPTTTSSAANWAIDFDELEKAITTKTKMIVLNTPREYPFISSSLDVAKPISYTVSNP